MKRKSKEKLLFILSIILLLIAMTKVMAVPSAPTVTTVSNTTKVSGNGTKINGSGSDSQYPNKAGGFIFTITLEGISQNNRWKAYVGNVSGKLTLDDADDYTIYDWTMSTSIGGTVFATRTSGSIDWENINCSYFNTTAAEELAVNHTSNPDDNISRTFNESNNTAFYVGNILIPADTCPTINLYVNDTRGSVDDFEEILLYDGPRTYNLSGYPNNFSNIIYATIIEDDAFGYRNDTTYDFQMILPEMGTTGWSSSTAYYFYVELN